MAWGEGAGGACTCAWYFNLLPLAAIQLPEMGTGQTAEVKEGQLASYNTGKGKLYLRLSKEIKRNFVAE